MASVDHVLDKANPLEQARRMSSIRTAAARIAARLLEWTRPGLARRIAAGDPTAVSSRAGRMILRAQARRAARDGDWAVLASRLAAFWRSAEGDRFYDAYAERGAQWFRGAHAPWAEAVCACASRDAYQHLVEIGCGDGRVLAHFAARLPRMRRLTGLDLNASIIARNRTRFVDDLRLSFESVDAADWLDTRAESGLFVTAYGGVFEYFPPDQLERLFKCVAAQPPSAIALVEPLADDFDPANASSRAGGIESSFSHPYRRMLEAAGFTIRFEQEARTENRWVMLVAERTAAQP